MLLSYSTLTSVTILDADDWIDTVAVEILMTGVYGGPIQVVLDWPRPAEPEPAKQFWAARRVARAHRGQS